MQNSAVQRTLILVLFSAVALLSGCYTPTMHTTTASFRPDANARTERMVTGRDCSFHLAGLPVRELDVREAARHALEGHEGGALAHLSSRVVYPAPFEVCVEVQGLVPAFATSQLAQP